MIGVLFICLGNICRSPMAEAVFRHKVEHAGLREQFHIDSAGLGNWHQGKPPHKGTQDVLSARGISFDTIRARLITNEDFNQFTYIVCMDAENLEGIKKWMPADSQVYRLLDFAPEQSERDVEDPYFTGRFEHVYSLVDLGCQGLLEHICQEQGLQK